MRARIALLLTVLGMVLAPLAAQAAGFGIYEWSARGNALGGTLVGRADDASAVAFNPAGMTQLEGTQLMAGFSAINPNVRVKFDDGSLEDTDGDSNYWLPPHFYATQQLSDRFWTGIGIYSRFGLGTEFPSDWPGRYNVYEAYIQSASVNPAVAVKLGHGFSFAAGVEAMWLRFVQKKTIDATPASAGGPTNNPSTDTFDVDAELDGDSWGYGFNVGLLYSPVDQFRFGLTYRSPVEQEVEGDADFDKPAALASQPVFENTGAKGEITLPDSVTLGAAWFPTENLSLEFDVIWTRWSTYDELKIKFDDPLVPTNPDSDETVAEKDWNDTFRLQFGVEYGATEWLQLRASYIYDESPVPNEHVDYMVPANDRHLFGVGTGFVFGDFTADLSYTYLLVNDRTVDGRVSSGIYEGEFVDGYAHISGVSVSYAF